MAHCTSAVHSLLEHWCEGGGVITSHMNILADHFLHELIQRQTQKQKCSYTKFFIGEFRLLKKARCWDVRLSLAGARLLIRTCQYKLAASTNARLSSRKCHTSGDTTHHLFQD